MPAILSKEIRDAVRDLLESDLSDYEIGRRVGISRATVLRWRNNGIPTPRNRFSVVPSSWSTASKINYSYLLGLYLGDGYVGTHPRTFSLVIACDLRYPSLVAECKAAVDQFATVPAAIQPVKDTRGVRVVSYGSLWPEMFPQHGPGPKHERKIELADWQDEIVEEYPRQFLRGLIHSDGSRCLNHFTVRLKSGPKAYSYPRYFFTNYSTDIQTIFCQTCDNLGVRWSQSNWRNISISHKKSVAFLDTFVGPKS